MFLNLLVLALCLAAVGVLVTIRIQGRRTAPVDAPIQRVVVLGGAALSVAVALGLILVWVNGGF